MPEGALCGTGAELGLRGLGCDFRGAKQFSFFIQIPQVFFLVSCCVDVTLEEDKSWFSHSISLFIPLTPARHFISVELSPTASPPGLKRDETEKRRKETFLKHLSHAAEQPLVVESAPV